MVWFANDNAISYSVVQNSFLVCLLFCLVLIKIDLSILNSSRILTALGRFLGIVSFALIANVIFNNWCYPDRGLCCDRARPNTSVESISKISIENYFMPKQHAPFRIVNSFKFNKSFYIDLLRLWLLYTANRYTYRVCHQWHTSLANK